MNPKQTCKITGIEITKVQFGQKASCWVESNLYGKGAAASFFSEGWLLIDMAS